MKNLARFIPIDGGKETIEGNGGVSVNGGTTGYGSNLGGSEGNYESGLGSIEASVNNIEAELENILGGKNIGVKNTEGTGNSGTEYSFGIIEGLSGNGGEVGYNGGTESGTGVTGGGIEAEVIGVNGTEGGNSDNGIEPVGGEYSGIGGGETGTTNAGSNFKVCGTNLPAKVSFWSKLKNFFKTEIAIEIPSSKKKSGTVGGTNASSFGEAGNGTDGNTSGGTGWSGLKNFFSFGKNSK